MHLRRCRASRRGRPDSTPTSVPTCDARSDPIPPDPTRAGPCAEVIAYVYGPMDAKPRAQANHDRASLSCVLSTAAFGAPARASRPGRDRLSQERSLWIQQTLESAVPLEMYPRSQIRVFVQVLQSDGGVVAAGINAATLALVDAGIPMRDLVVACSSGMLGHRAALDLSREEELASGAQVLVGMLVSACKVSLLEVESKVPEDQFQPLYDMAAAGCGAVAEQMRACLLEHAAQCFSLRASLRHGKKG
ncbi:unnamed protein product [Prorocentrum cordatum]|uniref:Uncharacterized protein n=1 Tax=Prorocentrum cordatum TaxID=2364126 RepID=A0ABN9S283_9DINO|nr:unnamed protein product [Polarella glacialis]